MGPDPAVTMGRWYLRWDKGEIFQVTRQDADSGQITIRTYDGGVGQLSMDDWRNLRPGLADPPSGNTAEKILSRLPCDVLLLEPDGYRDSISDQRRGARVISTGTYF